MANPLQKLLDEGVSVWLDSLSREMIRTGELQRRIREDAVRGQTSNPTIFQKAITVGTDYDDSIRDAARAGKSAEQACWELMVSDVQKACDLFRPIYDQSAGADGYVSLELDPTKAHDTDGSIAQALELWPLVNRPNLMLKVPGTTEGLPVIRQLLREGINVNVTLLFAVSRYEEVMDAHMTGLEERLASGGSVDRLASVASFFVSRVDTEADKRMDRLSVDTSAVRGRIAVANALLAYEKFEERTAAPRWKKLEARGARHQRPLWASTSTKNPSYADTLYVAELIGPQCVNTMPEDTIEAFRDHGVVRRTITRESIAAAHRTMRQLGDLGVDIQDITLKTLVKEGVEKFADSYRSLVAAIAEQMRQKVGS
ncbi:MAG: transaldolase [Armatimonadetes bacterium]|nr:transaldolase [Armatimonadota bacterium]